MSAVAVVLGADTSPFDCTMLIAGSGRRIATKALDSAIHKSASLRAVFLKYANISLVQSGFTSIANASSTLEARLARAILMIHDRVDGSDLMVTHERLAKMLAVRRSSVTIALQDLEGRLVIRAIRGCVTVLDRQALVGAAAGSYGRAELEYAAQIGPMPAH